MKKILPIIIMCIALFASCGESYDAKSHVKKFMTEQMGLKDYDVIAWSNIDSTKHVKDSMLHVLQVKAPVKKGTKYQPRTEKLNLITVKYTVGKDTLMSTFYLDDKLQGIVAMKNDAMVE